MECNLFVVKRGPLRNLRIRETGAVSLASRGGATIPGLASRALPVPEILCSLGRRQRAGTKPPPPHQSSIRAAKCPESLPLWCRLHPFPFLPPLTQASCNQFVCITYSSASFRPQLAHVHYLERLFSRSIPLPTAISKRTPTLLVPFLSKGL